MRTLLVLARISNLPTVWSNCLAAWVLAGGGAWARFGLLCLGATLLYTGGMFLNDAVDQAFDRRYRPERPIVAGQISSLTVWILSCVWLVGGWMVLFWLGRAAMIVGSLLLLTIIFYDLVHKHTLLAPVLMAGCRFLLYLAAAAAAARSQVWPVWRPALALAAYIIGLSYLARGESTGGKSVRWPMLLLLGPALAATVAPAGAGWSVWIVLAVQIGWTLWCICGRGAVLWVPRGVAGLLAGIVFVDWLAAVGQGFTGVFVGLFFLAVLLQRLAPAT
ncbi:MAG TPA: UbiA family prenyltransferase [Verrucomicrobiae bacterium]|nr:UbiA family prenyltransferase [Verrucomicrobiae bacterium]